MKVWSHYPDDECELCGSSVVIFTDETLMPGYGYDGDPVRCSECEAKGYFVVVDEDEAYVRWEWEDEAI